MKIVVSFFIFIELVRLAFPMNVNITIGKYQRHANGPLKSQDVEEPARRLGDRFPSSALNVKTEFRDGIERADCSENYFPCFCYREFPSKIYVVCTEVTVKNVQSVFSRTTDSEIFYFEFEPVYSADNVITLPADFLIDKRISNISIITYSLDEEGTKRQLVINPLAFRSSQNHTIYFELYDWDMSLQTDFSFLTGFHSLVTLQLSFNSNMQAFQYLPPLPSLIELSIKQCRSLSETAFPDLSPARLTYLSITDCALGDDASDDVLSSVAASTSVESLEYIDLSKNGIETIPREVPLAFPKLNSLDLSANAISRILSSSLAFTSPVSYLDLSENYHDKFIIESGAFQGNFTMAAVDLNDNNFALFEEGVFKEMLQQIMSVQPRKGYLFVATNPFGCSCDLAWLILENRDLLPAVIEGKCASDSPYPSMRFESLDPENFAYCSQTTPLVSTTFDPTTDDSTTLDLTSTLDTTTQQQSTGDTDTTEESITPTTTSKVSTTEKPSTNGSPSSHLFSTSSMLNSLITLYLMLLSFFLNSYQPYYPSSVL